LYLCFAALWALMAIWRGPVQFVPAAIWAAAAALWLTRGYAHRRRIRQLTAETSAEAAAAGVYPRVR
jgi:hypothetical protein